MIFTLVAGGRIIIANYFILHKFISSDQIGPANAYVCVCTRYAYLLTRYALSYSLFFFYKEFESKIYLSFWMKVAHMCPAQTVLANRDCLKSAVERTHSLVKWWLWMSFQGIKHKQKIFAFDENAKQYHLHIQTKKKWSRIKTKQYLKAVKFKDVYITIFVLTRETERKRVFRRCCTYVIVVWSHISARKRFDSISTAAARNKL